MAYHHDHTVGDGMLYELARRAGAFGNFVLHEVAEKVYEATGEDGEYGVEVWLDFHVEPYGYDAGYEVHHLPGTLYWNLSRLYEETVTIPVSHS